jgi:hypothetical protein
MPSWGSDTAISSKDNDIHSNPDTIDDLVDILSLHALSNHSSTIALFIAIDLPSTVDWGHYTSCK